MSTWWFVALCMGAGLVTFGRVRTIDLGPDHVDLTDRGPVTIVIPARNEAISLPLLLDDLSRSRPPGSRVIVVDDHSTDETAGVASAHHFVTLLRAPDLPPGWTGKSWACHTGAQAAPAGELIFLDADVRVDFGALDAVVNERRRRGGVVSVQPYHLVPTWPEQLSGLFNVVALMGIGAGGRAPNGIFGPVICCAADDYRSVGGHTAVRSDVVEDIALGRRFQRLGLPLTVFGGGTSVQFRMYPNGWRSMVEGWSKNMATGAAGTPFWRAFGTFAFICGLVVASIMMVQIGWAAAAQLSVSLHGVAGALLGLTTLAVMLRRVGGFRASGWAAMPVLTLFFVVVVLRSCWLTLVRRRVTWRGRAVPIGRPLLATVTTRAHR